ncbi:hypothetical protein G7Y29_10115 [Corynebacterium qintianiae]|uniref:Uncharacterized protein n=1 Tax=Corynebacterium qintianiae TaxID=2709392 RepID=A0A7T0KMR5_9CORY|nr:hypothetical protein [Corynebacterium qintianiae]QPK83169.1 hypothetical protein G7Y29_10115 [Corynebacterium qintianiae]
MTTEATGTTGKSEGLSWGLAAVAAGILTVDPALFGDDHVPYWACGVKLLALLFVAYTLSRLAFDPEDKKKILIFALV